MKPEHLAEEIRDGIKKLKARLDIPPAEDHDDLNGYMDALTEDADRLMNLIEAEKAELEKQEPVGEVVVNGHTNFVHWQPVSDMYNWLGKAQPGTKLYTKPLPPAVPDGFCIMPTELTAENGAKALLMGEFSEIMDVACLDCLYEGGGANDDCAQCHGTGTIEQTVHVSWTTIKEIYAKTVAHFSAAPKEVE